MRGNLLQLLVAFVSPGSIPARAGEPASVTATVTVTGVYPRACGGTSALPTFGFSGGGLSPRVRGNPAPTGRDARVCGSIPARAGEPRTTRPRSPSTRVYPRACGGTDTQITTLGNVTGLSPRVRGNPIDRRYAAGRNGSIPARAGEPIRRTILRMTRRVYPRACGGTKTAQTGRASGKGLSPRVRGNHAVGDFRLLCRGSIPARAGEPSVSLTGIYAPRVYPRACGGTASVSWWTSGTTGLSPRVRGNQLHRLGDGRLSGSIPARAGEPSNVSNSSMITRVYPRACGGTVAIGAVATGDEGLSPRVRGNRYSDRSGLHDRCEGSIPARAGEPSISGRSRRSWSRRVYPRACGGTTCNQVLEFFTMSKSTARFRSPLFAFYEQNPVSVHDLLRGFAEGFYAEISDPLSNHAKPGRPTPCQAPPTTLTARPTLAFGHPPTDRAPRRRRVRLPA